MQLSKDFNFLKARKTAIVEIPELGITVKIRELSIKQLDQVGKDVVSQLALMIIDDDGNQVFVTEADKANLAEMPATLSEKIFTVANQLGGVTEAAQEETVKN